MPTYVKNGHNTPVAGSSASIDFVPEVGHAALVAVYISDNTYSVSSFTDAVGLDTFGNPVNIWQGLGTINLGSERLELWGCQNVIAANPSTYQINVTFNGAVPTSYIFAVEYSGVTAFVSSGSTSNSGYNDLFFNGVASSNNDMLVAFFMSVDQALTSGNGVIGDQITPAISRFSIGSAPSWLVAEQGVIGGGDATQNGLLVAQTFTPVVSTAIGCIGVVITGGLYLSTPPGFSNIQTDALTTPNPCRALTLAQISENAALGMVRPEVFYAVVQHGDTIPEQISPVDGYQYSQDEQLYIYTPNTTFQAGNTGSNGEQSGGWPSASGILFYCTWDIQQSTDPTPGLVTCVEYYHIDGNTQPSATNDGQLTVLVVCQRAQTGLILSPPAGAFDIDSDLQGQDLPVTQSLMQALGQTSKFAAVKTEVFYMGEFVNGETVPQPISPADGYIYSYAECSFISSWKWTTQPGAFVSPPFASANGGNADGGWSQLDRLQASVVATGVVTCSVLFDNHGTIDPSDPSNGGVTFGRLRVFAFCQRRQGPNFTIPPFNASGNLFTSTTTNVNKINVPTAATGTLQLGIAAGSGSLVVTKVVIKVCDAGSLTVNSTQDLTFSSSPGITIGAGATAFTDTLSNWTFDAAHDYYVMIVASSGYFGEFTVQTALGGRLTSNNPVQYEGLSGDQSGVSTIPALVLAGGAIYGLAAVLLTLNATVADGFADIPINAFIPGQPVPYTIVEQIAANVLEGSRAVEVFGPTNHVNGDTIALPTSPIDGYSYSRSELSYIWQWNDTGDAAPRVFGFGASVSSAGVVSTFVWHVSSGSSPTNYGAGGSEPADGSIDVIVIACRAAYAAASSNPLPNPNSNPPSDVADMAFGGTGGFIINGGS